MEKSWLIHQIVSITQGNLALQAYEEENVRLHWDKDENMKTEAGREVLQGIIVKRGVKMRFTVQEGTNINMAAETSFVR